MQTKRQIQELLTAAGVSPNRRLGQHFLVDLNLMRLLIDSAGVGPADVVLEVGCGTGSLTEALAERAGAVVAVEIDRTLGPIAASRLAGRENVRIVNSDVLAGKGAMNPTVVQALAEAHDKINNAGLIGRTGPVQDAPGAGHPEGPAGGAAAGRLLLVSNLPYDVASPVMINLVKGPPVADGMYVTVQKEVALRMAAASGSGDYGTLSIFLQATGGVRVLRTLKPNVFWPPPNVDSAIVEYVRDGARSGRIEDMDAFGRVVGLFIGHRRKMLRACIRTIPPELGGQDLWLGILQRLGIDPTRRPGDLSPDRYVDLANVWHHSHGHRPAPE